MYGRQPASLQHVPEDFNGSPDSTLPISAYAEGKRAAELLCVLRATQSNFEAKIARCFAFAGPYLPLDGPFAFGNFIGNCLRGESIVVQGDGTTVRSYLYPSDLVLCLLTILIQGTPNRPYNVGSSVGITIAQLAHHVASVFDPTPRVDILGTSVPGRPIDRYVPSTERAERELGLRRTLDITRATDLTAAWHRALQAAQMPR